MIDCEGLVFEEYEHEDCEDGQREELLNHLELPEIEWTSVVDETDTVGWHHERVFNQCNAPAEENDQR